MFAERCADLFHDGFEVQVRIRNMERENAARRQMTEVKFDRLPREQMDRDGVPGERINDEEMVPLRRLALERKTPVTENDFDRAATVPQERELVPRELFHERVDLIEAEHISRPRIGRERARTKTDNADPQRWTRRCGSLRY